MSEVKTTNIRFNLGQEEQRKAWSYLQRRDRRSFPSYSKTICTAINDYFDRLYAVEDTEEREQEKQRKLIEAITEAVERTMEKTLPAFLSGYFSAIINVAARAPDADTRVSEIVQPENQTEQEPEDDEVDWAFLGDA